MRSRPISTPSPLAGEGWDGGEQRSLPLAPLRPITPRWQFAVSCEHLCQQLAHAHGEGHTVPAIAGRHQHAAVLVYAGNDGLTVVRCTQRPHPTMRDTYIAQGRV